MIARWMLYSTLVATVLTLAAFAAERLLRLWRREARAVWCVAMLASFATPLVSLAQALGFLPALNAFVTVPEVVASPVAALLPVAVIPAGAALSRIDVLLTAAWLGLSLALAIRFYSLGRAIARRRKTWRAATVDGHAALVSVDAGPAVVGFRSPAVVIPEWVLGLDASMRALVLTHEREHLERGDPRLLLGAVAAAVCAPWNPALWFQLGRLRRSMELDCDIRVLRAHPDTRRYGSLLLAVAQRGDRGGLLAPALSESSSLLSQRINAMTRGSPRHRVARTVFLGLAGSILAAVACDMRSPADPARTLTPAAGPAKGNWVEFTIDREATVAKSSPTPRYPDALRRAGVEGEVLAQYVVNSDGTVDVGSLKVLKSSHELFTAAVRNALPMLRYDPALVRNRPVRQLVTSPFTFSITK